MSKLYILAGSKVQADQFARHYGIPRSSWQYIGRRQSLDGLSNEEFVRCGTWNQRKDLAEIEDALRFLSHFGVSEISQDQLKESRYARVSD